MCCPEEHLGVGVHVGESRTEGKRVDFSHDLP
jgi:hypothetical protein